MKVKYLGKEFYIDNKLTKELMILIDDVVLDNEDCIIIIDGKEGAGKSKFSRQIAFFISWYLNDKHNINVVPTIDDLHFNLDTFLKRAMNQIKYQVNILDESRSTINRKSSTTKSNKRFTNFLSEARKFNQIHILNLPAIHDLEKYCVLWRAKYFIHIQKGRDSETKRLVRGNYVVMPLDRRMRFHWDKNEYTYPKFIPKKYGGFQGKFNDIETFDNMDKYEAKQMDAMKQKYLEFDKQKESDRDVILNRMVAAGTFTRKDIAEALGVTPEHVSRLKKNCNM